MNFKSWYVKNETLRRKCYCLICFLTCFLVSLVCLLSKNILSQGALAFVIIGEQSVGERDILIRPIKGSFHFYKNKPSDYFIDFAFLNFSIINEQHPQIASTSTIRTNYEAKGFTRPFYFDVILINTTKESEIGLGRAFPYKNEPLKEGECIVNSYIYHKNQKNNTLQFYIDIKHFIYDSLLIEYYNNKSHYNDNITQLKLIEPDLKNMSLSCTVKEVLYENYGKLQDDANSYIYMELEHFYKHLSKVLPLSITNLFPHYASFLMNLNPNEYGTSITVNFPNNRINNYIYSDYADLVMKGTQYANEIIKHVAHLDTIFVDMPIIEVMEKYNYGNVLVNLIMNVILFSLFILSIVLIYSLLTITIETNYFEFGIMRMIGVTKIDIIIIVILQCISFALPAFILALIVHSYIIDIINTSLMKLLHTDLILSIDYTSILFACVVNFMAPIIAGMFPIYNVIHKEISHTLNTMKSKSIGMKIEIISTHNKETNVFITVGVITFIYGFIIYYFLPLSLISSHFGLIGMVFLFILIGIVVGLVVLSLNIENTLQRCFTYILLFFMKGYMKQLIIKNIISHRLQNRKSSIMFSLSIGMFILVTVSVDIIIQSIQNEELMKKGTQFKLNIFNSQYFSSTNTRDALKSLFDNNLIEDFSYIAQPFSFNNREQYDVRIMNGGKSLQFETNLKGISPSYFNTLYKSNAYDIEQEIKLRNKTYKKLYTYSEQMYTSLYKGNIMMSGIFNWEFGLNINDHFIYSIQDKETLSTMYFISKPSAIFHYIAGMNMNSEPSMQIVRDTLITFPQYIDILDKASLYMSTSLNEIVPHSYERLPIYEINLTPSSVHSISETIKGITNIIMESDLIAYIWYYGKGNADVDTVSGIVNVILIFVCVFVLVFCIFNLTATMTINIHKQIKEITIYRSVGLPICNVVAIYVCESVVLIFTSGFIGVCVGMTVSYVILLQWVAFLNLEIDFRINSSSLIMIIAVSLGGGVISTLIPILNIARKPIAAMVRSV